MLRPNFAAAGSGFGWESVVDGFESDGSQQEVHATEVHPLHAGLANLTGSLKQNSALIPTDCFKWWCDGRMHHLFGKQDCKEAMPRYFPDADVKSSRLASVEVDQGV